MSGDVSKKAVGRSALWSMLEGGLSQLLSLAVFLVTAHFVAPAAFGLLATAMLVTEFFKQVVLEGVATAVNTQADPKDEDYNACFFLIAGTSTVIAIILFALAGEIAHFTGIAHLDDAIRPMCALLLTIGLSRTHEAYLSRHLQFRTLALRSLISITIGGTIGIVMAVNGFGLWALISQQIVTAVVSLCMLWPSCPWRPRFRFRYDSVMRLVRFARHVSMTGATNFANNQADIAFTSYYFGPSDTGHYNAAKRIGTAINQIVANSLNRVVMPMMARVQTDPERSKRLFLQAVSFTTIITAPIFAGLAALAPDAIAVMMGPQWSTSATILSIISVCYFLNTVGNYNQSAILVQGKPHWQTWLTSAYAVCNIALFLIVVRYGLMAVAIAYTARVLAFAPVSISVALYLLKIRWRDYAEAFFPATLLAIVMGVVIGLLRYEMLSLHAVARLAILIPAGAIIYLGLSFALNRKGTLELVQLVRQTVR